MAHFDTEYQRLEASYSDSPPGEENLLMHVPEGAKCKTHMKKHTHTHLSNRQWCFPETSLLIMNQSFTAQWHHIENLDLFFQRISFYMFFTRMCSAKLSVFPWALIRSTQIWFLICSVCKLFLNNHHVYNLHQKNGFTCMLLGEIFELVYVFHSS